MRLERVKHSTWDGKAGAAAHAPFSYTCFGCGKKHQTDQTPTFADLDGAAFRAYYAEKCLPAWRLPEEVKPT